MNQPTPEERIAELETIVSTMANQVITLIARSFALQELLAERGILPRDDVIAWMDRAQTEVEREIEFSPRYAGFRYWQRQREAGQPAPDDQI